ncbi:ABC transporter related protein [Staphylothermus hellenicus DSM 12710]|uniref:ABC transporter related protein n=1 Tax=Staphylothermus hellenicus (strain DSM 12710 / JCM 10830 / BK20S6-10-b1 / P8) TaxID=591019 RepID=D7D8Q2_STAHD|nr:ABC transporter related protein [Staphylothermus hellenicus DSM 12710]
MIKVVDLHKYYVLKGETVKALQGINLEIYRGEYVSVLGPSGSGKTTLFNMIGGLDKPTSGKVYVDGVDIYSLPKKKLAYFRNKKLGYVFQTYNLIPYLTAVDNVALPMIFAGVPRKKRIEKARRLLEAVGLGERLHHRPFELSGGQQQRVAIARALANDPSIILADEPTANLDLVTGKQVINLLKDISLTHNVTVVTNTHDLKMIDVSDRIVYIRDGKIERIEERQTAEIRDIIIDIS